MYAPVVGVEIPAGKVAIDVSVRYDGIATSGSSTSNIGARVGVNSLSKFKQGCPKGSLRASFFFLQIP